MVLWLALTLCAPSALAQSVLETHVTLGATPEDAAAEPPRVSHLVVQWSVADPYLPNAEPQVVYRIDNGSEMSVAAELVGRATPMSITGPVFSNYDTFVYGARIDVPPGATMQYKAGEPDAGWGEEHDTRMVPDRNGTLRVVAMADIGADGITDDDDPHPLTVMQRAVSADPDLVIIPGDLAYEDDNDGWDAWMAAMEPLFASTPSMPVPGNHEEGPRYAMFKERFVLPEAPVQVDDMALAATPLEPDAREEYFAFQAGPAYFIGLNSDAVCRPDPDLPVNDLEPSRPPCENVGGVPDHDQFDWLHDTLEDAREELDPAWIIVYFHHPPYSWSAHGDDAAVKDLWVPLFETYQVDLVVTGHEHVYQRTLPLWSGLPMSLHPSEYAYREGTIYVVTGGGGRALYDIKEPPFPPWWAAGAERHHVTIIDISPDVLEVQAVDADNGTVLDRFRIDRTRTPERATDGESAPLPLVWPVVAAVVAAALMRRRAG